VRGAFSLADVLVYPVLRGLQMTPQGASGLSQCPEITGWMEEMDQRPSIHATRWQTET
jgi:glutathione S-transferase